MRENLPPGRALRIGDLIVRKNCIYVIVSRTAESDMSRQFWIATGFYFWYEGASWENFQINETSFGRWRVTR